MPRCGQMSRSAKARPDASRPKTSGSPSMTLGTSRRAPTTRLGSARYQQSRSQAVIVVLGGSGLLRRLLHGSERLDLGGAILELRDLADRIELRVGQQIGRRFGVAERDEHHA